MADAYTPTKEDKFSFGLWTVGNPGRDPFGDPTRNPLAPERIVQRLSELGAWGINLHDNDLVPIDATRSSSAIKLCAISKTRWKITAWWCQWQPPIHFPIPCLRTGDLHPTIPKFARMACKKLCRPSIWAWSWAPRPMCFGAGEKARSAMWAKTPSKPSNAIAMG